MGVRKKFAESLTLRFIATAGALVTIPLAIISLFVPTGALRTILGSVSLVISVLTIISLSLLYFIPEYRQTRES
jgi:hypothetical protein